MRHGAKFKDIEDAGGHVDGLVCAADPGHTIITVLADTGTRYQAKLFNPAFLRRKGIPVPDWLGAGVSGLSIPASHRRFMRALLT